MLKNVIKLSIRNFFNNKINSIVVTILTIGYQTFKSGTINPVDELKYE